MGKHQKNLTHDEIWDDSVLVDSWNQALDEYKKYHSVHRNGATVEELKELALEKPQLFGQAIAVGEVEDHGPVTEDPVRQETLIENEISAPETPSLPQQDHQSQSRPMPAPEFVLGNLQDENLKKLLMSWYYAGYYTGVYDGQQQAAKHPS